jgi:RimJ/RimL family protein N-acetyltransferase
MENPKPIIVVRGKRVDLCVMQEAYLPDIITNLNDARITRFITAVPPIYPSEEKEWLDGLGKDKTNYIFAVLRKDVGDTPEYIGHMGIHLRPRTNGVAVTGAVFGYEHLSQGYGSEAKMLQLFYAFRYLGIKKIRSTAFSFNVRSQKYLERSGHTRVAVFRDEYVRGGKPCDEIHYELFSEQWEPIWEEYKKKHRMEDPF